MFTIDFLKKQGLPEKSRVAEIGLFSGIGAVSLLILLLIIAQHFNNKTVLGSKEKELARCEKMVEEASGKGNAKSRIEESLKVYDKGYFEIADSIGRYVQWTPVLREFVNSMPPSMLLNELSVVRSIKKVKVASRTDPKKKVNIEIVNRLVKSDVHDFMPKGEGTAVENYLGGLRKSELLKDVLDEAYIVQSSDAEYKDSSGKVHKARNHVINCVLKSQEVAAAK